MEYNNYSPTIEQSGPSVVMPLTGAPPEHEAPVSTIHSGGAKNDRIRPFRKRSVEWLKSEAKRRGFTGYSKKKKDELVEMLKGSKPPKPRASEEP